MATASLLCHLECSICLDVYRSPITLHCQHSFCRECLRQYSADSKITCPNCRAVQLLPDSGVDSIPTHPVLQALVDSQHDRCKCPCGEYSILDKCGHCDMLICSDCIDCHNPKIYRQITKTVKILRDKYPDVDTGLENIKIAKDILLTSHNKAKNEIIEAIRKYKECLLEREKELLQKADHIYNDENSKLHKQEDELQKLKKSIADVLEAGDSAVVTWDHLSKEEMTAVGEKCSEIEEQFKIPNPGNISLEYNGIPVLSFLINSFGRVTAANKDSNKRPTLRYYTEFGLQKCFLNVCNSPQQIAGLEDDTLIVAIPYEQKLDVVSLEDGKVCRSIVCDVSNREQALPRSVAVLQNGDIAVADYVNHCLLLYRDTRLIWEAGREGQGSEEFWKPLGLSVFMNEIYVCDLLNNRIQVLSEKGKFMRHFGEGILSGPRYITSSPDGRVLVTDSEGLKAFSASGEHLQTVVIPGTHDHNQYGARGVAVDDYGNVLVAVDNQKSVKVFYPDLQLCCTFGEGDLEEPEGVCVLPNGRVAITDWNKKQVVIY